MEMAAACSDLAARRANLLVPLAFDDVDSWQLIFSRDNLALAEVRLG